MKPNFALNLSHEGISLLHRAKAGWLAIGGVSLDDPSLVDELGVLRRTAADLEAGGMTTKLVIPNSQILYTEVDAPGPSTADRIAQIRDGLVGLTPYDVRDLVFDWRQDGDRAQVAVVARETLNEAEAFAIQYRFNPVSFVAMPADGTFGGEPFFGPTRHAATVLTGGETVQPDAVSIQVLGSESPQPATKSKPKPKPKPKAKPAPAGNGAASESVPASATEDATVPEPAFSHRRAKPAASAAAPDPSPETPVTFASRRANGQPAPIPKPPPVAQAARAEPPVSAAAPDRAIPEPSPAPSAPSAPPRTPLPVTSPDIVAAAERKPRRSTRGSAKATGATLAGTLQKIRRSPIRKPAPPPPGAVAPATAAPAPLGRAPSTEAEAMTVFGARRQQPGIGAPRYIGLALTLILLLALAILAIWSTYFMSDVTSGWFGTFDDDAEITAAVPGVASAPPPLVIAPTPIPSTASTPTDTAAGTEATTTTGIAPDLDSAAPEQPAAELPVGAETGQAPVDAPAGDTPAPDDGLEIARLEDPSDAEVALPEATAPAPVIRRPLTRSEAEARYAATGIWQLDPDPLAVPGSDRIEGLTVAAIDPALASTAATRPPAAEALDTDLRLAALLPPAALGTAFDLDDRGLVRATSDGAIAPGGFQVILGQPAFVPGPRPEGLRANEDETLLDGAAPEAAEVEPAATTEPLDGATEVARLGGFSRDELAAIRPAIRPASLWVDPEAETPLTDREAAAEDDEPEPAADPDLSASTDLAVAVSNPPSGRPGNFGNVVEAALQEAARSTPNPRAEPDSENNVATARVPSIPTRASVAKQATERNAINLNKVNLIGVYGTPSNRSALVRLKSGRFVKVEVGDRVDGGRVAAIGEGELRYIKGGRNITLKLPKG
ncbi:MAG: hypothetical protein QNJ16_15180 [Rhodobacter sp.]|nr:hypothetical protein [Rhodobacter sp.]